MLSEVVRIRALEGELIHLDSSRKAACGKCSLRSGCGQFLLGTDKQSLILARRQVRLEGEIPGNGGTLQLGVREGVVTRLALLFYCMPLALLLLGTLAASLLTVNDAAIAMAGLTGLLAGLLLLPRLQAQLSPQLICSLGPTREMPGNSNPESKYEC